jgi:hypothetical protein
MGTVRRNVVRRQRIASAWAGVTYPGLSAGSVTGANAASHRGKSVPLSQHAAKGLRPAALSPPGAGGAKVRRGRRARWPAARPRAQLGGGHGVVVGDDAVSEGFGLVRKRAAGEERSRSGHGRGLLQPSRSPIRLQLRSCWADERAARPAHRRRSVTPAAAIACGNWDASQYRPQRPDRGARRPATGDRRPATGDRRPATGDRRPATGDRRPATLHYLPGGRCSQVRR